MIEQFFFGGLLHVEAISNRTMIDLFKSLVTSFSKGLNNLRPRATPCGFCEVLKTFWAYISGLISTMRRSVSYTSHELASRLCACMGFGASEDLAKEIAPI